MLIGLGTSAISDAKYAYMQNEKVVEKYRDCVLQGELARLKSHRLTEEDMIIRECILKLLCTGRVSLDGPLLNVLPTEAKNQWQVMEEEGLVILSDSLLEVTETGKAFIRNIAMVLDAKLRQGKPALESVFSKAI